MTDGGAVPGGVAELQAPAAAPVVAETAFPPTITVAHRIADVADDWRRLAAGGVDSPGQSLHFVELWCETQGIAEADQVYARASVGGAVVALLPLWRQRIHGVSVLSWFPGAHVGCNAPLVDGARLARLTHAERRELWRGMLAAAGGDLLYLRSVPVYEVDGVDIFAELGESIAADVLHRARFENWAEADRTQRGKSRRKHDRQQGERLEALGRISFEVSGPGADAAAVMDVMFRQRSLRFRQMGVADPFAGGVRKFYDATVAAGSPVPVRLHVLRLEGEIIAVRYNIAHGDRLFCLISSMSGDETVRAGSPGKQCLLRVMQQVFDAGMAVFDMGAGQTDEKRHWCNEQVALRHHYLPLTWKGALAAWLHRNWQAQRQRIKANARLLRLVRTARTAMPWRGVSA